MDSATRLALEQSIEKWRTNEAITDIDDARTGSGDCPLCELYHYRQPNCDGCPVMMRTGQCLCQDTPYHDAYRAHGYGNLEAFKVAARREREFLESLQEDVMNIREDIADMYRKLNPQLNDDDAEKLVDDFFAVASGLNRRQMAFLNLAVADATVKIAGLVGEYLRGVVPADNGARVPSRDLAVMLSIIASVLVRVREDKGDAMLTDFMEATRVLLKMMHMSMNNSLIDGLVKERVDAFVENVERVEQSFGIDHSKDAEE